MSRLNNDVRKIEKLNKIVKEQLPSFASQYFKANIDVKAHDTLYGYALDLVAFFDYLESECFQVDKMTLKDLNKISPDIIENYINYSFEYVDHEGTTTRRSSSAVKRRFCALSSFLEYFFQIGALDSNPAHRVNPPKQNYTVAKLPSVNDNKELINYVSNGNLEGRQEAFHSITKERDAAILMLLAGTGLKVSEASFHRTLILL